MAVSSPVRPDSGEGFLKTSFRIAAALLFSLTNPAWAGDAIRIGFVSTFSGPAAAIGNDARNGFELALDHLGRKMDRHAG